MTLAFRPFYGYYQINNYMKKFYLSLLAVGIALSSVAQSKLDLQSRAILRSHKIQQLVPVSNEVRLKAMQNAGIPSNHITGLIKMAADATAEQLEAEGVNVVRVRGDIALVSMPVSEVARVSTLKAVKKLQLSRKATPKMDLVRKAIGVDKIHSGEDLPQAYTGKGVIAGIVDGGVDPNHINFRNEDGTSRFSHFTHIFIDESSTDGYSVINYSDDVAAFKTDDESTFHGTHTLGIMAGGYKGKATVAEKVSALEGKVSEIENPFYGVATGADIAASCGDLYDMLIALGIEGILDHAYNVGKPAVVNLSVGSNVGGHDGKTVMSQYLDLVGKEAIVCMAAGNEGSLPVALSQRCTEEDKELKTFIAPLYTFSGYQNLRYGQVYIYSEDDSEFIVKAVIYNKDRGTITFQLPIETNTGGEPIYYSAGEGYVEEGDKSSVNFSRAFNGYLGAGSMIDEDNGRYCALIDFFVSDNTTTNAKGNYILGFVVEGKAGQRIDCYGDAVYTVFDNYDQEGWDEGMTNGSINDMACAQNLVVVGSYNTRDDWASLDGEMYTFAGGYPAGEISDFSSYGTLIDGRNLPHVCAPGATTISSSSTYYIESESVPESALQAKVEETGRKNYWHQQVGTSMATPVVTGAIALWLEADPTLTVDEVKEIIAATAVKDEFVTGYTGDPVKWGAGKFNAYAGLKEVIRRASSGISSIAADDSRLMVKSLADGVYNVFLGGVSSIDAVLYDISGQPVLRQSAEADELDLNLSGVAPGVYVLNVNGRHAQRILVK